MPLPPALLERLKKRKIIHDERDLESPAKSQRQNNSVQSSSSIGDGYASVVSAVSTKSNKYAPNRISPPAHMTSGQEIDEPEEEIIAEDYDSDEHSTSDNEQALGESIEIESKSRLSNDNVSDIDDEEKFQSDRGTTREKKLNDDDDELRNCLSLEENQTRRQQQQCNDSDDVDHNNLHEDETNSINLKLNLKEHESVIGCPNKYNIYHTCGQYCRDKYAQLNDEHMVPSKEQRKQLALLLKTFPISNEWTVVYDPGVRTFYFWNITTGQVSWVPPGMSAFASPSANQIREAYMEAERQQRQHQQQYQDDNPDSTSIGSTNLS